MVLFESHTKKKKPLDMLNEAHNCAAVFFERVIPAQRYYVMFQVLLIVWSVYTFFSKWVRMPVEFNAAYTESLVI